MFGQNSHKTEYQLLTNLYRPYKYKKKCFLIVLVLPHFHEKYLICEIKFFSYALLNIG